MIYNIIHTIIYNIIYNIKSGVSARWARSVMLVLKLVLPCRCLAWYHFGGYGFSGV